MPFLVAEVVVLLGIRPVREWHRPLGERRIGFLLEDLREKQSECFICKNSDVNCVQMKASEPLVNHWLQRLFCSLACLLHDGLYKSA